eukprot:CAMPEP_0202909046 /NCGR_PEP_ID=MMETSP1392-20130828/48092_1 /ASSEMBLY_ACC=CAM_ASM_000868 /TAXON_ID=225041 /ORGANISM="Chlamydomonas chlamydogama, Strain SAG 11-48b" /LENGTH=65 /DNA_ID=CAMNT_0049598653 /DNA_START=281 /DNA_END=478 /DNA_ORIENTATION=-
MRTPINAGHTPSRYLNPSNLTLITAVHGMTGCAAVLQQQQQQCQQQQSGMPGVPPPAIRHVTTTT